MGQIRQQREALYLILQQSQSQSKSAHQLHNLMQSLGFEEDVSFAKSLFSDRISQIYRETQGEYQSFLSNDSVHKLDQSNRFFLLKIFRKFHQYKLKSKKQEKHSQQHKQKLELPDQNNIQEIIKFQKDMYKMFKGLIPSQSETQNILSPIIPDPKYAPFPVFHDRNFRNFDQQFFPQMGSPFLPNFQHKPFGSYESNQKISSNKSINYIEPYNIQRPSFFSKSSYHEFQKIPSQKDVYSINKSLYEDSSYSQKMYSNFAYEQPISGNPQKKVKRDTINDNFKPENLQNMRKQLDFFNKSKSNFLKPIALDKSFSFQEEGKTKEMKHQSKPLKKGLSEPPIQDRKPHTQDND